MPGIKISSLTQTNLAIGDVIPAARSGFTIGVPASFFYDWFAALTAQIQTLSTAPFTANDSDTILLNYNSFSRTLSAELANDLDLRTKTVQLPESVEIPPGSLMLFADNAVPDGWLLCDGGSVVPSGFSTVQGKTADFTRLHNVLGTRYGLIAGTLPNFQSVFNGLDYCIKY